MLLDIRGKVNNMKLGKTNSLLPVFEAVVNSLQSIEMLKNKSEAYINIVVARDIQQIGTDLIKDGSLYPISKFTIEDNGIGFNNDNYNSFNTSDSTYKLSIGGKGNGRFLWLKAFDTVKIESVYEEGNKKNYREISFVLDDDPIRMISEYETSHERKTVVHLDGYKALYREFCPKKLETIGLKIIEHCISFFILNDCPRITISDEFERISLNDLFRDKICVNSEKTSFSVKGENFEITHIKLYLCDEKNHILHYCANKREVTWYDLSKSIVNLDGKIKMGDEDPFLYAAYLSGEVLNECVNNERTGFNLSNTEDDTLPNVITLKQIEEATICKISEYLKEYIDPINETKVKRIQDYIYNESPQYRSILKYRPEKIERISPRLTNKELEIELFKISQELNLELKKQGEEFLSKKLTSIDNINEYKNQYMQFIEKENDLGKSSLAQYIVHRKVILTLLENGLQIGNDSKYEPEEYIHNLIFPMRKFSDDIDYEKHNLWIIDERLAYHYYLASDIKLNQMEKLAVDSEERPDLLIIDNAIAVVNQDSKPYGSVVIVEFKRPMRNNYDYEDNPISQVLRYVKRIRSGNEKDKNGRLITIQPNTPFYLYIICDITKTLIENADTANLTKTPDGMGYFGYYANPDINAYIEIISFDKLLDDAKKRNKILFDKLFKPMI